MRRWSSGIALLLLAACGDATPPPPPNQIPLPGGSKPPEAGKKESSGDPQPVTSAKKEHVDKKGRSKSPELFKKYLALMESNGDLLQSIEEDVGAKKGDAAVKPKVLKIVKNAEAARALHYRKDPEEDVQLDADFDLFLFKMKKLTEAAWDADSGKDLLEDLGSRCRVCHDKFQ